MGLLNLFLSLVIVPWALVAGQGGGKFSFGPDSANLETFEVVKDGNNCSHVVHDFSPLLHKQRYRVGVYSSLGDDWAKELYGPVFEDYLDATAGRHFNPPVTFEVVPVSMASAISMAQNGDIDFLFASSAVFTCMAVQFNAQALVTIINRRESRGYEYDLDVYGGVMFTLKDQEDINDVEDFKGRIIGAGDIVSTGGGQTQFYEMYKHGLSYVADPKQVVFTKDERRVVQGVLDGEFEVGFASTGMIEQHITPDGKSVSDDTFKIINPQTHVLDNGQIFPFMASTALHPEWPFAAMDKTDQYVTKEVQEALLALLDHAISVELEENLRCDTTPELAQMAIDAQKAGSFTGFRTARSYDATRTQQEAAGFLNPIQGKDTFDCVGSHSLYDDIQCPAEYYKVNQVDFRNSCADKGMQCSGEQYECFCAPCIKAFEVDVYQYTGMESADDVKGCEKMSLCGTTQQTKWVTFRMTDRLERKDPQVRVIMHWADLDKILEVQRVDDNNSFTYEFTWGYGEMGVAIMEILFDGVQIPESPMRLQIVARDCEEDYPGRGMDPNESGQCVCGANTSSIGDKCVPSSKLAVIFSLLAIFLLAVAGAIYMQHRYQKGDEVWKVDVDELHFDQPPEVIGQGSFGVVLKAEYRGTKVAIKRALRSNKKESGIAKLRSRIGGMTMQSDGSDNADSSFNHGDVSLNDPSTNLGDMSTNTAEVETPAPKSSGAGSVSFDRSIKVNELDYSIDSASNNAALDANTQSISDFGNIHEQSIGFLNQEFRRQQTWWEKVNPFSSKSRYDVNSTMKNNVVFSATGSAVRLQWYKRWFPYFDETARQREEFKREMRVLSRLRHPAITTVMGAVMNDMYDPMLVMEYMEYGSLHDMLRNETMYLSGEIILQMTRDLAQGMRFLHGSKPPILHGDLKARNILVDSKFRAKICDFGLSTKKRGNAISGTPFWLPPEYLRGEKEYDTTCDMYSIGVIFYEIFSRKTPYEGENFKEVLRGVCSRGENKRPEIPKLTPPKFANLMKKCWSADPQFRPRAMDLDIALLDMDPSDAEPYTEDHAENQKRSGEMLYELFPKKVADQLRKGEKVEPESHELVTIIFSDIIHFTDISRTITPEKVCDMLDRLYHAFDKAARKHKVFKVETIGDAYMGVTNLEGDMNDSHVKHIAEFACDMVNEATKIEIDKSDPSKGKINIRVGFHSGPVVSNVIGSMNKRYGLFGDSVNTASRMESNSSANRILCSEASCKLLKRQAPDMMIKRRGKIKVKGKGEMVTYWIGDDRLNVERNTAFDKLDTKAKRRSTLDSVESLGIDLPEEAPRKGRRPSSRPSSSKEKAKDKEQSEKEKAHHEAVEGYLTGAEAPPKKVVTPYMLLGKGSNRSGGS